MQKIKDIRLFINNSLKGLYPESELRVFTNWILEYLFDYSTMDAIMHAENNLKQTEILKLSQIVSSLKKEVPIQQILGYAWFYGNKFYIDNNVLIPRPETEELVDWILKDNLNNKNILDIGSGSGCIPISIALNSNATVSSVDICPLALKQAKENANNLKAIVSFSRVDILNSEETKSLEMYDVIVSNPPYVLESDKALMANNVLDNEPHLALFVPDNDALKFYTRIAQLATHKLNNNGLLYFEIHEKKGAETVKLLSELGYSDIELRKDFQDKNRMVKAVWKL